MTAPGFWPTTPWIVGHRGSPRLAVENTAASFEQAIADGADMVEFDVRRSKDGVLFVYHGLTLPTSHRLLRVPVSSLTYDQICAIVSKTPETSRAGRRAGGVAPPRLEDVARQLGGRIKLNVEIKTGGYEVEVIDILRRHVPVDTYVITSFRPGVVRRTKAAAPQQKVGLLLGARAAVGKFGHSIFRLAESCNADFLVSHAGLVEPTLLDEAQRRRIPVMIYTVNRPDRLARFLGDPRVAGVITDTPKAALAIRDGLA